MTIENKVIDSAGTPQWVLFTEERILLRSIFGSQESTQNRLMYALEQMQLAASIKKSTSERIFHI